MSNFKLQFGGNTITYGQGGSFIMFPQQTFTLTLQNDGHGTISADKITGYAGDTVTLSNTYNTYYRFNNYTQTGGTLNGSTFTFGESDATAKANFKVNYFTATGNFEKGSNVNYTNTNGNNSWSYTNVAAKYALHQAHTGDIDSAWYNTSNRWKPNNVSAYSLTMNTKMTFTAHVTRTGSNNWSQAAATGVSLIGGTQSNSQSWNTPKTQNGSWTWSYNKTFTTTTQNVNYGVSARLGSFRFYGYGAYHNSTAAYIANGTTGTWTATGIAP